MDNAFFAFLAKEDVEYKRNLSLKELSSVKIGGNVFCVLFPDTIDKLILLIQYLSSQNIKWKIIGRLTNLLPRDEFCPLALISTARLCRITKLENQVTAECGTTYSSFLLASARLGLLADTELFGIPGSIGGMIYSNAGAYGREISDRLFSLDVFSPYNNQRYSIEKSELDFGYRKSTFQGSLDVILSATFSLDELGGIDISDKLSEIKEKRKGSQPIEYPSLGCVFKRYNGVSAGYYIDKAGLKGLRVGGAEVSYKHAGFIVNVGGATSSDFSKLIGIIKETVYNKFKILLEEEIEYM